jgi:formimidoylglutamate deiminase
VKTLHADRALLPEGWTADAEIAIDDHGLIAHVRPGAPRRAAGERVGVLVPGVPNLHSHAFQRALAGRTERAGPSDDKSADTFWTWRERMYDLAQSLTPEALKAVASGLYAEMLRAGYTAVCEFHYLHHGPGGRPYADPAAMSQALIEAAAEAGIRLTLLPVLYMHGGFGGRPPEPRQARFVCTPEEYLALTDDLGRHENATTRIGTAFHSLRAVDPPAIGLVLAHRARVAPGAPVHMHVAEQAREVAECEVWSGRRPVEWLLGNGLPDERWCLVHATHMTPAETRALAQTGVVVALCPTTEANLGDGLFPLAPYLEAGGRIGIGSDSHVSVSPVEELRWLEYGQRLAHGRRNVAATAEEPHTGARLYRAALAGGAQALGQPVGRIAAGCCADFVELAADDPLLAGTPDDDADELLDRYVFAGSERLVRATMVAGRWVHRCP